MLGINPQRILGRLLPATRRSRHGNWQGETMKVGRKGNDLLGERFGRLLVTAELQSLGAGRWWLCLCDCGNYKGVRANSLRNKTKPVRSCKCLNLEAVRGVPYASLYHKLRKSSATQGHACALTFKQFLEYTKVSTCHYCNATVTWAQHNIGTRKRGNYNLDRKDNSKGYSTENCVVCCTVCNLTRGNRFTYEQFVEIGKLLNKMRTN
jgi:hypothetical protein